MILSCCFCVCSSGQFIERFRFKPSSGNLVDSVGHELSHDIRVSGQSSSTMVCAVVGT